MRKTVRYLITAAVVGVLLALAGGCLQEAQVPRVKDGQAGTTLSAEKTAEGFWKRVITYDWTIEKKAELSSDGKSIIYTLTATRTKVSEKDTYGVEGKITVTNGGAVATENLKLVDQVEYKIPGPGQFGPLPGASQTITPAQLGPGATGYYNYEITFTPVSGATYRNTVKVTITNHSGHLGEEFGPEPKADFSLPSEPTITYIDRTASIEDKLTCPDGFTCNIADSGYPEWNNIGAGKDDEPYTWTVTYTLTPGQGSTVCDTVRFENTATLTESNTKETRTASAGVSWNCANIGGCTYTQGYWKNHPGMWPAGSDPEATFFESGQTWLGVLKTPPAVGNAYYILAHQYIAAKLNILNGADPAAVATAITWAEKFFNEYTPTSTLLKSVRNQATSYANLLDQYNNGYIGPGHCSAE
jgi:hypothetical protein